MESTAFFPMRTLKMILFRSRRPIQKAAVGSSYIPLAVPYPVVPSLTVFLLLFLLATGLARLVALLGLVVQGTPHFSQFLSNATKGQLGIFFLEFGTMFLGEQHESRQRLLAAAAAAGLLLAALSLSRRDATTGIVAHRYGRCDENGHKEAMARVRGRTE